MQGWTDNANNFYVGLICEVGLLGVLSWILSVLGRSYRTGQGAIGIAVVAVTLITGPHLDFMEIGAVAALVISSGSCPRAVVPARAGILTCSACIGFAILFVAGWRERGMYQWESEGGSFHQWASPVAELRTTCRCESDGTTAVRLGIECMSGSKSLPTTVQLSGEFQNKELIVCTQPGVTDVVLPCVIPYTGAVIRGDDRQSYLPNHPSNWAKHVDYQHSTVISIRTTPGWTPALRFRASNGDPGNDWRLLGVRIRNRNPTDLLPSFKEKMVCSGGE